MCNFFQPDLIVLPCLDLTKIENSKKLTPKLLVVTSKVIQEIKPYKKVFDRFHNTMGTDYFKMKLNSVTSNVYRHFVSEKFHLTEKNQKKLLSRPPNSSLRTSTNELNPGLRVNFGKIAIKIAVRC
jgi:hypothetical protein